MYAASSTCLNVDPQRMTADVEGMITYEALVDETLKYGLLPAVVPQLKTITVAGRSAAWESNRHPSSSDWCTKPWRRWRFCWATAAW